MPAPSATGTTFSAWHLYIASASFGSPAPASASSGSIASCHWKPQHQPASVGPEWAGLAGAAARSRPHPPTHY
eukprot:scaffold7411_cov58-Phaeocystis_antarctica.AAC.5